MEGFASHKMNIFGGIHQGCLLYPLLLHLFIEARAIAVQSDQQIHGICLVDMQHKLAVYLFIYQVSSPPVFDPLLGSDVSSQEKMWSQGRLA